MSERMSVLAHPSRIFILDALRDGERSVQSIADGMATTQQNVSGHLRLLRAAGIVSRRPAGREAHYVVIDETVFEVWRQLLAGLPGGASADAGE